MKQKDLWPLVVVSLIAGLLALVISNTIFKASSHTSKAPNIQVINANLPDIKNDSTYNSIFYAGALDPTQPVQIGASTNNSPFQGQ